MSDMLLHDNRAVLVADRNAHLVPEPRRGVALPGWLVAPLITFPLLLAIFVAGAFYAVQG